MSGTVTSFCEAFDELVSVIKKDELQEYQEIVDFFNQHLEYSYSPNPQMIYYRYYSDEPVVTFNVRVSILYGIQAWEIFDEYDRPQNIEKFIDAAHEELKTFLLFHIDRCRSF